LNYDDLENTTSAGFLVEDKLHLASVGDRTARKMLQASVVLGCCVVLIFYSGSSW
jgi:hypothetical protein